MDLFFLLVWWCNDRVSGFDCLSDRYQVVTTWMDDCLRTGKPSCYLTNIKINSTFHPSGIGE